MGVSPELLAARGNAKWEGVMPYCSCPQPGSRDLSQCGAKLLLSHSTSGLCRLQKEPSGRARCTCAGSDERDGEAGKGLGCLHGKGRTGAWENSLSFAMGGSRCPQGLRGIQHLVTSGAGVSTLHVKGMQGYRLHARPGCSGVTALLQDDTWDREALQAPEPTQSSITPGLAGSEQPLCQRRVTVSQPTQLVHPCSDLTGRPLWQSWCAEPC